ncbi:DUF2892 domain-containing protein [Thiomicrospira sp. R3]|uniref:YgaP family membrane protein n=1 Tax=Thiomicrospira sp. R3 TaxID=3035472 RepID=UPI00259B55A3|nr:DUF2892 domain-containing protein [Thiomicrospira sp. R3]WFE68298.1 DUF2892 domain-containing protein [Thiomicrospira sp. R3]
MIIERVVLMVAGSVVLVSLALAVYVSQAWLLLTAFVGLNLIISGVFRFCPMVIILKKLGLKHGSPFLKERA